MRKFLAALGRALAEATKFVWQLTVIAGKIAWALVPKPAPVQPSVSAAEALADVLDAEHDEAKATGGMHRSPLGVAVAHYARDPSTDIAGLPEDLQIWLATLSDGERAKLAGLMPHQIERHIRASGPADWVRDLPPVLPLRVVRDRAAEASAIRGLKRRRDPNDEPEPAPAPAL